MGLFSQILTGAIAGTFAVGTAVVKGGIEAVKEGSKIYDEYQKNPKMDIADKVIGAAGKSLVAGAKGAGECIEWGYENIKKDIQQTKEAEKTRIKAEKEQREKVKTSSGENGAYTFYTKVVGVTYYSQSTISYLQKGQTLKAVREPNNSYDRNAIAIYSGDTQIGHLSRELAADYAAKMDKGAKMTITVEEITGGGSPNYGVNIKVYYTEPQENSYHKSTSSSNKTYYEATDYSDDYLDDNYSWDDYVNDAYDGDYEQAEDDYYSRY